MYFVYYYIGVFYERCKVCRAVLYDPSVNSHEQPNRFVYLNIFFNILTNVCNIWANPEQNLLRT